MRIPNRQMSPVLGKRPQSFRPCFPPTKLLMRNFAVIVLHVFSQVWHTDPDIAAWSESPEKFLQESQCISRMKVFQCVLGEYAVPVVVIAIQWKPKVCHPMERCLPVSLANGIEVGIDPSRSRMTAGTEVKQPSSIASSGGSSPEKCATKETLQLESQGRSQGRMVLLGVNRMFREFLLLYAQASSIHQFLQTIRSNFECLLVIVRPCKRRTNGNSAAAANIFA